MEKEEEGKKKKKSKIADSEIGRGFKLHLRPNQHQRQLFDLWRNRTRQLWNLLLRLENAAYSGDLTIESKLGWRSLWAEILQENYRRDAELWENGRPAITKAGKPARRPALEAQSGEEPLPPDPELIDKILHGDQCAASRSLREAAADGEEVDYRPKLFIRSGKGETRDLLALVARLKQAGETAWIGDLTSHASQCVAKDLVRAIGNMLRERAKRAAGLKAMNTGFPRFKRAAYGSGSVYFANTQITKFDAEGGSMVLPGGIGPIRFGFAIDRHNLMRGGQALYAISRGNKAQCRRFAKKVSGGKLMGGRLYRHGEEWWLSLQYSLPKPSPLPITGRSAGVKIAAAVPLTIVDSTGRTRQIDLPPQNMHLKNMYKWMQKKQSRQLLAKKEKEEKFMARLERAGKTLRKRQFRQPLSKEYYATAERLAILPSIDRDQYNDLIHRETTRIVQQYDKISVQRMDVAKLLKKKKYRSDKRNRRQDRKKIDGTSTPRRDLKSVRQIVQRAAMGWINLTLAYKARDYGREYIETAADVQNSETWDVQKCSACGAINSQMRDGRGTFHCESCGHKEDRRKNAARHALARTKKGSAGKKALLTQNENRS